jgi:hypothetical protein
LVLPNEKSTPTPYVSGAAVAALLLGLLSPLAFIGPLLWAAPVMGVSIALFALVQLDRAEEPRHPVLPQTRRDLRDELHARHRYVRVPRVGAAGGIGTPAAA